MKYFTQELLANYGSNDDEIFVKASYEWEVRCEEYRAYIESLNLPPNIRKLSDIRLHDAEILELSILPKDSLCVLWLKDDWGKFITVKYMLVNSNCVEFIYHPEDGQGHPMQWWLYEELIDHGSYYKHSILVSGGREIGICFTDVEIL